MHSSHRLWTRVFLVGGLILFGVGLLFISNRQKLFSHTFEVYAEFDRVNGLQKGAKVHVSGMTGGEVVDTEIPKRSDRKFRLKLRIEQALHPLVSADSVAAIKTMGLAGNSFIDIQKGTSRAPVAASGSTLLTKEPFDIADLEEQVSSLMKTTQASVIDLREQADGTLQSVNSAASATERTIVAARSNVLATVASARKASENLGKIVAQVKQGEGTIGELVMDQNLADSVSQTVDNARQSSLNLKAATARASDTMTELQRRDLIGRAQGVLDNSRQMTEHLNQAITAFTNSPPSNGRAATNLRDTLASAQTTMANLAADSEAAKHNFLLRGFFKKRGYFDLNRMTPAVYKSSKFLKGASSKRVWLSADQLFSSGPDGREILTVAGERQVDNSMNDLIPYLPNSPLVVEGYAMQGPPNVQYVRAKQRAIIVQNYIKMRFGLQPDMVGTMPMSDSVPPGLGRSTWDGVSVVTIR